MRDHTIRMGKKMDFTSQDRVNHPESFWCLDDLKIPIGESVIEFKFVGYHNIEAYNNGASPIAGAVKSYQLHGEDYMNAINLPTQKPKGSPISVEILTMAWTTALNTKDVPVDSKEDNISFFETTTDLTS